MSEVLWEVYVWEGPAAASGNGYGQLLAQVPGWMALSLSPLGDAVGAGSCSIPLDSPIFWQMAYTPETTPVLAKETLWQVRQNGETVFEFLAQQVDRTTVGSDETRTATVSGPGAAQCLNWGMAMPFGWTPTDGGFVGVTGAIQDNFQEQDVNGNLILDIALWNLCTPGACSIPGSTAVYTQAAQPTGQIQVGAVWNDTATKPAQQFTWDGGKWVPSANFTGSASGGGVQVALSPGGAYLGGGEFSFVNSSFSASVSPAQPFNPSAPGVPLDNDPANGSDSTQLVIEPGAGTGRAEIGLSYQEFYCKYQDKAGNLTTFNIGPGRLGGTGAYDPSWAQYWRISCDQQSGGYLFRYWTSGDGATWVMQWSHTATSAQSWDPHLVDVFLGGTYNTTGVNGAYAQFSSINGEIQANPENGPIYINVPAMAVTYDQLARIAARGTIPFVSPTFTASSDTDGNPWVDKWSVQVPLGTDGLTITQNYAGANGAHWFMRPGYLLDCHLLPGRQLQNQVIFHEGEITQYGRTQTRDQIYNVGAAQDGSGMIWTETDPASITQWAQREIWAASGGTIDAQSAVNTAAAAVDQWGSEVDARIIQIPPNAPGKTAFIDFQVWDWIGVERSDFTATDALQVIGITVSVDQDGAETHELVVNTYRQVMAAWFAYLMNKFGGQSASTLGSLTPGTTAGSAFTLALGPNLAISPAQTGGKGGTSGLGSTTSIATTPEVAQYQSPAVQPGNIGTPGTTVPGQGIPGQLIAPASLPPTAVNFTALDIGGIDVYIQATPPAGNIAVKSLWYDSSNGYEVNQWNGRAWGPIQFGTNAIQAGSVTAALIAAGTITATQIAAGTITGGNIAAGTVTASNIASNTITVNQLAAGIVYAGMVDGTTITGASLVGDGTNQEVMVYSGVPAAGNLIGSWSAAATTDAYTNTVNAGLWIYDSGGNSIGLVPGAATQSSQIALSIGNRTPTPPSGTVGMYGAASGTVQLVDGVDGAVYGTARRSQVTSTGQTVSNSGAWQTFESSAIAAPGTGSGLRNYRVHAQTLVKPSGTVGPFHFQFTGPGSLQGVIGVIVYEGTSSWSAGPCSPGSAIAVGPTTLSTSAEYLVVWDGVVGVPVGVSGILALQATMTSGQANVTIAQWSFLDMMPV